jgi:hypothetical protein
MNKKNTYVFTRKGVIEYRENPWSQELAHTIRKGGRMTGFASSRHSLVDIATGEVTGDMAVVGVQKVVDKEEFVKLFGAGIIEVFDLSKPGKDLFKAILHAYLDAKNQPDQIYINYIGLVEDYGYSKSRPTFSNAMAELLHKGFMAPVTGRENLYWINPNLFYKGDRIRIVREYVREGTEAANELRAEQEKIAQRNLPLGD